MCNASKDCEVKYSLTMRHKPSKEDDDKGFYEVNVLKKGQHLHKVFNTQLRGDARQDVVDDVLLNHNGSAEDWVNHMVTSNVELQKRMLFVDSSGGLVKMTKQMNDEYQRVRLKLKLIRLIKIK